MKICLVIGFELVLGDQNVTTAKNVVELSLTLSEIKSRRFSAGEKPFSPKLVESGIMKRPPSSFAGTTKKSKNSWKTN
jgi:hypothetical protein